MARPPKGQTWSLDRVCPICGQAFRTTRALDKKFCGVPCYARSKVGRPVLTPDQYKANGERFRGERNPFWKGAPCRRTAHREWCRRNRDKCAARTARRKARKKAATGAFTDEDWARIKRAHGYRCAGCDKPESLFLVLTVDHIVPLALGGSNDASNIQPLCLPCNSGKGARPGWVPPKLRPRRRAA